MQVFTETPIVIKMALLLFETFPWIVKLSVGRTFMKYVTCIISANNLLFFDQESAKSLMCDVISVDLRS